MTKEQWFKTLKERQPDVFYFIKNMWSAFNLQPKDIGKIAKNERHTRS